MQVILVFKNIRYMRIFAGVPSLGEGASNDSVIVEVRNVHRLLLAVCSETLDRICSPSAAFQ